VGGQEAEGGGEDLRKRQRQRAVGLLHQPLGAADQKSHYLRVLELLPLLLQDPEDCRQQGLARNVVSLHKSADERIDTTQQFLACEVVFVFVRVDQQLAQRVEEILDHRGALQANLG
jgi:hypothetical protein